MSNASKHLSLPFIQGGQAQKHVTHNEALRSLDLIVQLSIIARSDAPTVPVEDGNRYVVIGAPTGDWAGQTGQIAHRDQGVWQFTAPQSGWVAWDENAGVQVVFDGTDWIEIAAGGGAVSSVPQLGINASADATNRLAVASDAVLFTHGGTGHQVKVNKASAGDTASLLFQTNWSGRAEMGLTGSDDFEIKVSADGASFLTALKIDAATGAVQFPQTELSDPAFGASPLVTQDYVTARSDGLVTNATGYLGNAYNAPSGFLFDPSEGPNLPGAFAYAGYFSVPSEVDERIAIDPNRVYRISCFLKQQSVGGDWSAFPDEERHTQFVGLRCYDADGLQISAHHHQRHYHSGIDSLTVLTQPLAPGDVSVRVSDSSGWNETLSNGQRRGLVIFEYQGANGRRYDHYSRIEQDDLFELGDVNKATHVITLNKPLPASMGNPDDPGGVWPVGTRIANRSTGFHDKFACIEDTVLPAVDIWFASAGAIGGVDTSGRNLKDNFPPGTASVTPVVMANHSNRSGGFGGFPDTGAAQRLWIAGLSVLPDVTAQAVKAADGSCVVHVISGDPVSGTVSMGQSGPTLEQI